MRFSRPSIGPTTTRASRRRPRRPTTFTSRGRAGCGSTRVFRLEETRTVSNDWVVRYANRQLQLERQSGQAPARSTVVVCESVDGHLEIRYRDRAMRWTEIVGRCAGLASTGPGADPRCPRHRRRHAWPACRSIIRGEHSFKQMGADGGQLAAAGSMKSPWTLPEPWTPRTRPPLLAKRADAFRTAPTGINRGDISNELTTGTFLTSFDTPRLTVDGCLAVR